MVKDELQECKHPKRSTLGSDIIPTDVRKSLEEKGRAQLAKLSNS